tara:strand:+ start:2036 stop:2488 length:453 start_codon:yes stop_codon:yes gene_type:complete
MNETLKEWMYGIIFLIIAYLLITWHRDESVIENKIFDGVNEIRSDLGIHKLTRNSNLDSLAVKHSTKMKEEYFFEHSNDNVGENIFDSPIWYWTEGCGLTITNNQIANCMVKGWSESPGHYANMIDSSYSATGLGVSCNIFECKGTQNFR